MNILYNEDIVTDEKSFFVLSSDNSMSIYLLLRLILSKMTAFTQFLFKKAAHKNWRTFSLIAEIGFNFYFVFLKLKKVLYIALSVIITCRQLSDKYH